MKSRLVKATSFTVAPLAAAVASVLYPVHAVAQDANGIEEVVVTATKRELDLQDVAQSISAFTEEDLKRLRLDSMEDYVRALPSVYMQATKPGRNQLVMRGISTGSDQFRTDSQVAIYLDEQPMTSISQQVGPNSVDMERIESLPGPQGTLFGSSSQTGTIRMITNKPDFDGVYGNIEASVATTSGGDDSYEGSAVLNLPLIDDVLSLRLVGYSKSHGGFVDNVLGSSLKGNFDNADVVEDNFNTWDLQGGRAALKWNINDNWQALFSIITERNESDGSWESDPYLGDFKITRFVDEYRDEDWYSSAITIDGDLGFADLSMTYAHFDREIAYELDRNTYSQQRDRNNYGLYQELYNAYDPNYVNYNNFPLYYNNYLPASIINDQSQERDSIEVRLTSQTGTDDRFHWVLGVYYEDVYDEWFYYTHVPGFSGTTAFAAANAYAYYNAAYNEAIQYPLAPTDIGYSNTLDRTVEQLAVFGEFDYDVSEKLTLSAGVRWANFERNEFESFQFPQGLPGFAGGNSPGFSSGFGTDGAFNGVGDNSDMIYKLGARYQIDDDKMVYALHSQGFRLGGQNSPRAAATGLVPQQFAPDFLDNFEIGVKSQWMDNTLQLNISAFYMEWSDYQSETFGINGTWWLNGKVNGEGAETTGLEVTAQWEVSDQLYLSMSAFAASPEFSGDFYDPNDPGSIVTRDGMPMPGSPERKAFLGVDYSIPDLAGGTLSLHYDIAYQAETWNSTGSILSNDRNGLADAWTYSNLSLDYQPNNGSWWATLFVENLFDQRTYSWVNNFDNGSADLFGDPRWHNVRNIDRPRTIWLTLNYSFGDN
jgi:outer membrane receptor protein involved in Fe transport